MRIKKAADGSFSIFPKEASLICGTYG